MGRFARRDEACEHVMMPKGSKPPPNPLRDRWLLLRGLGREQAHWFDFPARLQQPEGGPETLCLDLPGTGSEWRRATPSSIPEIASDVRTRLAARWTAGDRLWILGISLGGMVAIDLARQLRARVAGVVIANASVGECPLHERLRPRAVPTVLRALLDRDPYARERRILALTSSRPPEHNERCLATAVVAYHRHPLARHKVVLQLLAASRFRLPDHLPAPLLVLRSRGDRLVNPRCSERIARHFDAPLREHATAGHDLPLDAPDWVAAELHAFQSRVLQADDTGQAGRPVGGQGA